MTDNPKRRADPSSNTAPEAVDQPRISDADPAVRQGGVFNVDDERPGRDPTRLDSTEHVSGEPGDIERA